MYYGVCTIILLYDYTLWCWLYTEQDKILASAIRSRSFYNDLDLIVYDGLLFLFPAEVVGGRDPLLRVASSVMKRKSLEVVLSLFNKHHDARNPANPSKQPKNGERVRLYQTGTLFTSAGLIEREPAAELYINFFHMVDVAGQPTDEGGKGKEKASSEKDNNNKPLEFSMNNTGSLYDEKQDKVKIRASFDFTIPVFAALYHLYKRKLLVLQQYFTLYTNQRQKCNDILGLTLPPLFPRCTNLPNLTSGTAQTLRNTSWYFRHQYQPVFHSKVR